MSVLGVLSHHLYCCGEAIMILYQTFTGKNKEVLRELLNYQESLLYVLGVHVWA
jgi:hypothetical protein